MVGHSLNVRGGHTPALGRACTDRFELGSAVIAITSFVVLIGARAWLMVLPV
jgi:hypothetical protein